MDTVLYIICIICSVAVLFFTAMQKSPDTTGRVKPRAGIDKVTYKATVIATMLLVACSLAMLIIH